MVKIALGEADKRRGNLLENILEFNNQAIAISNAEKQRKKETFESVNALYQGRELVLNDFQREIFLLKQTQGTGIKILTPKQMSQVLQIALTQVKTDSTSERLLHEIGQVISLRESVRFWSFSGPHFLAFGLDAGKCGPE